MLTTVRSGQGIAALRRFVRAQPIEICELCGTRIPARHGHVVEPASGRVLCTCLICGEAVTNRPNQRYRLVPQRATALADFRMSDAEWHRLGLPVELAFLFHSTQAGGPIALYPGPLGATQSVLAPDTWTALVANNTALAELEPDVEALLVDRTRRRRRYFRVPIDRCYALVAIIRTRWQGWSGGDAVWQAIDDFLGGLTL